MYSVLYRDIEDGVMGIETVNSGYYNRDKK